MSSPKEINRILTAIHAGNLKPLQQFVENTNLDVHWSKLTRKSDMDGETVAHIAARWGHVHILQYLLNLDNNALEIDSKVVKDNINVVKDNVKVVKDNCDVVKDNCEVLTDNSKALQGNITILEDNTVLQDHSKVLDPNNINTKKSSHLTTVVSCTTLRHYKTPLHEATQFCHFSTVALLVASGADVNALKRADWTPLMLACVKTQPDSLKIAELLIKSGAAINFANKDGWTVAHLVARDGNTALFNYLINNTNSDLAVLTNNGRTVLHVAAKHGNAAIVKLLLSDPKGRGLINKTDNCGNTALHDCIFSGYIVVVDVLVKCCKQDGVALDVDVKNQVGLGVMHMAAGSGSCDMVRYVYNAVLPLCEKSGVLGVNVASLRDGFTPLHWAAKGGYRDVYKLLVELGGDEMVKDFYGRVAKQYFD